ncbi:MAG: CBS domain-containing protein [Candidatus Woesearchaeota archaeon]
MKTGIRVFEAMTHEPVSVNPDDSIAVCAITMKEHDVGGVLVVDGDNVLGICTEQDMVHKILADNKDYTKIKVKEVMSKNVRTIEANNDIFEAIMKMRDLNVRRMPVVNEGKFVGILTDKDILKIEPQLFDILVDQIELREESRKPLRLSTPDEDVDEIISKD